MNRTDSRKNDEAELCLAILACAQPAQLYKQP